MRKLIIFLFTIILIIGYKMDVKAETFIAGEAIPNVYRNKEKNGEIISSLYQPVIRNSKTNEVAYCIEPFASLIENYEYKTGYQNYASAINLSEQDYDRISALVYYGYGYTGHNDLKWYAITQILIWRTVDKEANFYWVDKPYGKKIDPYKSEIAELEKLVSDHNKKPNFANNINYSINKEHVLIDENNILSNFKIKNSEDSLSGKIEENKIIIKSLTEGIRKIKLERLYNMYGNPIMVYTDTLSQNVIQRGNIATTSIEIELKFIAGSLSIRKVDKNTKDIVPGGSASLIGAIYHLYDEENKLIEEMVIGLDNEVSAKKLALGKYKIMEIQSGTGYYLNEDIYEIEINENNLDIKIDVVNEVINNKITIKKYYGNDDIWKPESNIMFNIYNSKGELYDQVMTDINGITEIVLPYDTYTFTQINTSDSYQKVSDFYVVVDENSNKEVLIELYDVEINVPNTYIGINKNSIYWVSLIVNFSLCTKVYYEYA